MKASLRRLFSQAGLHFTQCQNVSVLAPRNIRRF